MKKTIAIFCTVCISIIFVFSGCAAKDETLKTDPNRNNSILQIYTADNELMGEIENYGTINFAKDSIIYQKIPNDKIKNNDLDYYRYDIKTGEHIKLGTVKDWIYQAPYRVLLDNHLYISATTGDMEEAQKRNVKILDIDLNNNSMSEIASYKRGNPYSFMAEVFGRIWFIQMTEEKDFIEEYDPETKELREIKSFQFDNDSLTGETVRGIYADDNAVYIMVLKMETEANVELRMDVYDKQMNFLRSVDLSSLDSDKNELRHVVYGFKVLDDHIYYENFSSTSFFGKIEENGLTSVIEENGMSRFSCSSEAPINRDRQLIFRQFFTENKILLFDRKDGSIKSAEFYSPKDERCQLNRIHLSGDDMLIYMDGKDFETGEVLPSMMYYVNINDLDFQDYTPQS